MISKVNKNFVKEMQSELDRKSEEFDGKDNPKCYKNMSDGDLLALVSNDINYIYTNPVSTREYQKKLIAIANRCGMIWEKLN